MLETTKTVGDGGDEVAVRLVGAHQGKTCVGSVALNEIAAGKIEVCHRTECASHIVGDGEESSKGVESVADGVIGTSIEAC